MTKCALQVTTFSLAVILGTVSTAAAEEEFVSLFNGKDLEGWVQRGGKAKYAVEDGAIVGQSIPLTPNSFLCTAKTYRDFVLELEFKVDAELNSGIQFRSNAYDEPTKVKLDNGKTKTIPAKRVHGYQFEIDNSVKRDRWWTGGVYDEGRRGWLFPGIHGGDGSAFTNQGRDITKKDDWNKVRIETDGDSIKTYLNGELRSDFEDSMTPEGFIALQVHGVGSRLTPITVRWRNIRIIDRSE